jgi:hypothetical protein
MLTPHCVVQSMDDSDSAWIMSGQWRGWDEAGVASGGCVECVE